MYISASSIVSPVGLNARAACAAIRAGITRFKELRYRDDQGEPIIGATVPTVVEGLGLEDRLFALLVPTLNDVLNGAGKDLGALPLVLVLSAPERPGGIGSGAARLWQRISRQLGDRLNLQHSIVITTGQTGGFEGLRVAEDLMRQQGLSACVVSAVDSLVNAATLDWLEGSWRLKVSSNPDGLIPGEAAAAVLLTRRPRSPRRGARVVALGFGHEPATLLSGQPLLGSGLTDATREALRGAELPMHDVDFRITDVTGEQYGMKEQAIVLSRLMRQRRPACPIWHATESIGDTGVAAALIHLIIADQAFERRYAPGPHVLLTASDLFGRRAAAVARDYDDVV